MASDDSEARLLLRLALLPLLDGVRPSGTLEWASAVAPAVTQAAVGAGHWASGRRQRALAAWASAAGSGLVAWGVGTEAPARAQMVFGARSGLRHPRRLTVHAIASETPNAVFCVLRAASAEPLR